MATGELEPDPELADDTLGGRISETQSGAEPTWSGSWWAWVSLGTGGSTMPHVRMWERLQSSQAHLFGRRDSHRDSQGLPSVLLRLRGWLTSSGSGSWGSQARSAGTTAPASRHL